ncbi:MAG TPA: hypothetical protein H9742_10260 [Candidatus Acetatifactor stercoripullorum]|uniref:ABC transporter permease n=1 Tax=Candidatus Acetatifactor stercoripullorum TaxID=2838414 RepID=A0A9D1R866_9FIRM|nr:hypothetical protein [uncultured Acetatifactor sp.]HIW81877.1 hypothetical protein [Candidatus Acetatifactor stercoripullorum]
MYHYTVVQWLFFFYFYCFFGWCFESAYVSIKSKRLVNRGFMRGPFLPLYGCGAIMMLVVSKPFQENLVLVYIAGCLGATVLEYVTGVTMEALFKVRYWDYSKNKFNFQGHICLGSSLAWGGLTILMTEVIHKPVERLVLSIPGRYLGIITFLLSVYICVDFALSFKAALDLRDILVQMERAKEEMMRIQKRLDVIIALTEEDWSSRKSEFADGLALRKGEIKEGISMRMEDVKAQIDETLEKLKNLAQTKPNAYLDSVKEEIFDLKVKYKSSLDYRSRLGKLKDFFQRGLIRSNPTMSSEKFREALEELKKNSQKKRK